MAARSAISRSPTTNLRKKSAQGSRVARSSTTGPASNPAVWVGRNLRPVTSEANARARPLRAAETSKASEVSQAKGGLATDGRSDSAGLEAWAAAKGIESPSMVMANFMGLRGMKATKAIDIDDALVTLPKDAALLVVPRMSCPFPDMCSPDMWKTSPWWFKMALLLLEERRKGSESRLSGYVEQLPRTIDTTLHWTEAELKELQYPPLVEAVRKQRDDWADIHRRLREGAPGSPITQEDLYWAIENVRSRVFSGPYTGGSFKSRAGLGVLIIGLAVAAVTGGKVIIEDALNGLIAAFGFNIIYDLLLSQRLKWYALCPVIDFMNHNSNVESDVSWEYFGDRFVARAMKPWKEGEQVFINYGIQSNDSLLQYYGFVEEDNPNDCYVISDFGRILDACSPEPGLGPELWQKANIAAQLSGIKVTRQGVPAVALVAARLVMMPESLRKDKGLEAANAELPPKEEEAALRLVKAALQSVLESTGTKLQEDEKLLKRLQRDDLVPRAILAAQFRIQKKRLLEEQCRRLEKKAGRTVASKK